MTLNESSSFCRGTKEAQRRLKQLANGTAGFTVYTPKIKSWKQLDTKMTRKGRTKAAGMGSVGHEPVKGGVGHIQGTPSPTGRLPRSTVARRGEFKGVMMGTLDVIDAKMEDTAVEVKTTSKKRADRSMGGSGK